MGLSLRHRLRILRRDGFRCVYCGRTAAESRLEVDHQIPRVQGGSSRDSNLVTACRDCNQGKGAEAIEPIVWQVVPARPLLPESPRGRCPDERHPGPLQEVLYGPPEDFGSETALICLTCRYIVARRHRVSVA